MDKEIKFGWEKWNEYDEKEQERILDESWGKDG